MIVKKIKRWLSAHYYWLRFLKPFWSLSRTALRAVPLHLLPATRLFTPRPAGYHESVAAYLTSDGHHAQDSTTGIYPAEEIERQLPESFGHPLPRAFSDHLRAHVPAACVHLLHDVRFWGHYGAASSGATTSFSPMSPPTFGPLSGTGPLAASAYRQ